MTVAERPTIVLRDYDAIRQALQDPNLSRTFDTRSYAEGNIRDGVVSVSHGSIHRARRRVENTQFRADRLQLYERDLFPVVLDDLLRVLIDGDSIDVFPVGELVSVVLAARRAGLDIDDGAMATLHDLVRMVDVFSQGSAILDARDPDAVRALVRATYDEFDVRYVRPAWARRAALLDAAATEPSIEVPHDILTALLQHRDDPALELADDGRIVREVATYLQGGTHTSAQTMTNASTCSSPWPTAGASRLIGSRRHRLCQRAVHETSRLRPTTPRMKRLGLAATTIAGVAIPADALVILDAGAANRDPRSSGRTPTLRRRPRGAIWRCSVGTGFRRGAASVSWTIRRGGLPGGADFATDEGHLFGLVALCSRALGAAVHGRTPTAPRNATSGPSAIRAGRTTRYVLSAGTKPESIRHRLAESWFRCPRRTTREGR